MTEKVKLELDEDVVHDLTTLAYSAWCRAYDAHKAARNEKDDGSQDWAQFHEARVRGAVEADARARRTLDAIKAHDRVLERLAGQLERKD